MLDVPDEKTRQRFDLERSSGATGRPVVPEASWPGGNGRLWRWILRLTLPLLILLSGLVLYWIWFDNLYGTADWWDIVGGIVLSVGAVVLLVWALATWCSTDVS